MRKRRNARGWPSRDIIPAFVQEALLDHPLRRRILNTVRRWPGLNKNQLRDRLDVHPNLLDFHLERLKEGDLLVLRPSAQRQEILCFAAEHAELWEDEHTRILFGRTPTRNVGLYLAEHPGATAGEISDALGIATVTVRHHLRTLRDHGLVFRFRAGRQFLYEPAEELADWASDVGTQFDRPWGP